MKKLFYMMLLCMLSACTEAIDFDPYSSQKIVVNCLLTSASTQYLTLTYSNKVNEVDYERISHATITLFSGTETIGSFKQDKYNEWQLDYKPVSGKVYHLSVEVPDYPPITAYTTMPQPVPIEYDTDKQGIRKHFIQQAYDKPYWAFVINKHDEETSTIGPKDKLENSIGTNHEGCDGFTATGSMMSASFGSQFITKENYAYLRLIPQPGNNYSFFIEAPSINRLNYFRAVSDEYDRYLKTSVQKMLVYQSHDDPSQWFDESTVYSNIENGLGIFGAYIDVVLSP